MATTVKTKDVGLVEGKSATSAERIIQGVSQVGIGLIVMSAGLTGIWALASLISAIAKAGGVASLLRSWWTAITGM